MLYIDIAFITVNVVDLVSFIHDSKQRLDKKSVAFHIFDENFNVI